ncbi:PREDICTED: uncharacterized protein LOC106742695 isoform X3 [Dinoponera quadriceps]|uniref:Uncharacterized protein LOC106742695 isoform X3 n=1 Tax=Dinoponera quadriceps TaxID=609295 RepID=A0A6P3X0D8_DINQU|nr:PREDICTED: uncharacterized protein LOC106742695 isoform X3 [Dinoponera quadriceps]
MSNGEMTDTRKRKSHDNDDVSTKGPVINNNGGQTRNKKINNKWNKNDESANIPVRILTRKYLLTKMCYKFIEIGITATLPSHVSVVIGNNYGKEISPSATV